MFKNSIFTLVLFVLVCVVVSVATACGGFVVDAYASYGQEPKEPPPANYPRLAQNLQNDLNSALSPEFPFSFETAGNPFRDSSGVSLAVSKPSGVQTLPGVAQSFQQGPRGPVFVPGGAMPPNAAVPSEVAQNQVPLTPVNDVDSKRLLAERNRRIRQGQEAGDLAEVYSVDDVRPIGVVGSGERNRVLLYSPSTKQTFSVRKGTKFRDGTIEAFTSEGAVFRRDNGTATSSRWLKNSEKSAPDDPEAPVLRVKDGPIQTASSRPVN